MNLYSYRGKEPTILPDRIRLDDGSTRSSLDKLSLEELKSFGFSGPIIVPEFDEDTHRIEWNGIEYEIIDLPLKEVSRKKSNKERLEVIKKLQNINYNQFWDLLVNSDLYKKIRFSSTKSLEDNIIFTELMILFSEAKMGKPNVKSIQICIDILFLRFDISTEEVEELQNFMDETYLSFQYIIPDKEYISSHVYDFETNTILKKIAFDSWNIVNGEWKAPVQYPNDGKLYKWNEELLNWVEN